MTELVSELQRAFWAQVADLEVAATLREASLAGKLGDWTRALTQVAIATCHSLGWACAAKGSPCTRLPVSRHEYLGIDVTAFRAEGGSWPRPIAVFELENQTSLDLIAYAVWKTLTVSADLRVTFCYRRNPAEAGLLVKELTSTLGGDLTSRLVGPILLVVGSRGEADSFPYGYFTWWRLESGLGRFTRI